MSLITSFTEIKSHHMVLCLAYRPFQHENTGYTPNMLMLWKEVATLLYGKSAKLTSYWYVPYKIVQQHTVTFKIRKDKKTKTLIVHVDRLRP